MSIDDWSQLGDWSWEQSGGFLSSVVGSDLFVSCLVEEALDSSLPMLSEMGTLKYVIVFYHVAY